jgi:hypothetical protein
MDHTPEHPQDEHLSIVVERQVRLLIWPTILALLVETAAIYLSNTGLITTITIIALSAYVVLVAVRDTAEMKVAVITAALVNGFSGACVALYTLIRWLTVVNVFNFITQPVYSAVIGAISAAFLFILMQAVNKQKGGVPNATNKQSKERSSHED